MPAKRASTKTTAKTTARGSGPEVIVDFEFERGFLFIAIRNIGSTPAYSVRVEFDPPLFGLDGTRDISTQALFNRLEFLPPGKTIRTLLDSSASYFRSGQRTRIAANVTAQDARRRRFATTIQHDLEIYRDIGYVNWSQDASGNSG